MTRSRLPTQKLWLYAYGGACALATAALLVLPVSTPDRADAPEPETYAGADHKLRVTALTDAALPVHFASATADSVTVAAPSALPALVGVAGGSVWLKSATTGEVERVPAGGELDGWRVVAVRARSATLARNEERQTLELYRAPPAQGAVVSGPVGPNGRAPPTVPPGAPPVLAVPPQSPPETRPSRAGNGLWAARPASDTPRVLKLSRIRLPEGSYFPISSTPDQRIRVMTPSTILTVRRSLGS